MVNGQSPLGHHLLQIPVAQRIPQIPAHAQNDHFAHESGVLETGPTGARASAPPYHSTLYQLLRHYRPSATSPSRPPNATSASSRTCSTLRGSIWELKSSKSR